MCPTPSFRRFSNAAFETVLMFVNGFSAKIVKYFLCPRLSHSGDQYYGVLGFVPAGSVLKDKSKVRDDF